MGDDTETGRVCFDFCRGAGLHCWVCRLWSENDLRRQSVTWPVSVASPLNNITLDVSKGKCLVQPLQWWAESAIRGWNRVKVSENLGRTVVVPVAPVDTVCSTDIGTTSRPNISIWNQSFWAQIWILWPMGHGKLEQNQVLMQKCRNNKKN